MNCSQWQNKAEVEFSVEEKETNTILQKAPDSVKGREQNKAEVEISTKETETNTKLQKAPDIGAQAKVNGCQEQNKAEVGLITE